MSISNPLKKEQVARASGNFYIRRFYMNEIQVFQNQQFGAVRVIEEDGKVLFCGNDVARALGYTRPGKAIIDHCKGVLKRNAWV